MFSPIIIVMMMVTMMTCEEMGVLITWMGRNPSTIYTYIKSPQCILKIFYNFVSYTSVKLNLPRPHQ